MATPQWQDPEQDFPLPPSIPPLYRIRPLNPENFRRESLTSLIIRTARAHAVSPRDMIREVLGRHFKEINHICKGTFFRHYAAPINGLGRYATLFTHAMEELTAHSHLSRHTLLPIGELVAAQGSPVIHPSQRWCQQCYREMMDGGVEVYRPLIWSFAAIDRCHLHDAELEVACPHCGVGQPVIPRWPDLAFCDTCRGSLFDFPPDAKQAVGSPSRQRRKEWNLIACTDLVEQLHQLDDPSSLKNFMEILEIAIAAIGKGNRAELCRRLGLSIYALGKILRGTNQPSFETFLRIGYALDLRPSQMLLKNLKPPQEAFRIVRRINPVKRSRSLGSRKHEKILRDALDLPIPPPVSRVAADLNMTRSGLKYRHPETYTSIVEKRRKGLLESNLARSKRREAFLRSFVVRTVATGLYPGKDMVEAALRQKGWSLLRPELRLCYQDTLAELVGKRNEVD